MNSRKLTDKELTDLGRFLNKMREYDKSLRDERIAFFKKYYPEIDSARLDDNDYFETHLFDFNQSNKQILPRQIQGKINAMSDILKSFAKELKPNPNITIDDLKNAAQIITEKLPSISKTRNKLPTWLSEFINWLEEKTGLSIRTVRGRQLVGELKKITGLFDKSESKDNTAEESTNKSKNSSGSRKA